MSHAVISADSTASEAARTSQLFCEHQQRIFRRTDRLFACLMPLQWLAAIATAYWISPLTWTGATSRTHPHVYAALILGGLITVLPVGLAVTCSGAAVTRFVIATGQMLMSALLIHLTGGRIETHFHVFGSLAFMAFYRDWRVFLPATAVVAADHLLRGIFWPQSVFGILVANPWRWLEHAGWVLFEDTFLLISCSQSIREMWNIAQQRAQLEGTNQRIEAEVIARTAELREAQKENLEIARRAGMADIATNVLHNVGNVLNSVNVSTSLINDKLRNSGIGDLRRAAAMLEQHLDDPGAFVSSDPRGKHLPRFLVELSSQITTEEEGILSEITTLSKSIGHIKEIVTVQQNFAVGAGFVEQASLAELLEDALRINSGSMEMHKIDVVRELADLPAVLIDKQKFLQIVMNLLSNARNAVLESQAPQRQIGIRLSQTEGDWARIEVSDNGVGIPAENLTRIFSQGFTTRKNGHGFGLHSAANHASELGGHLKVQSAGLGHGATFVLEIPIEAAGTTCAKAIR
jgi:signal transduction histidine kinase